MTTIPAQPKLTLLVALVTAAAAWLWATPSMAQEPSLKQAEALISNWQLPAAKAVLEKLEWGRLHLPAFQVRSLRLLQR
ncbi:MAG: hypothetical protein AAFX99_15050 [Myxococcota bacterium]